MKKNKLPIFLLINIIQCMEMRHKMGGMFFSTSHDSKGPPKDYLEPIKI